MAIEYDTYRDEDGNLQIERVCGWCGSNRGFYKERVSTKHRGSPATYHENVTYCRNCKIDVERESDGYSL